MRDALWQTHPPWVERALRRVWRYSLFVAGCLLLSFVLHLYVMYLAPAGLVWFEPRGGGLHFLGWPLACAEGDTIIHPLPFVADVLLYFLVIATLCYWLIHGDINT